MNTVGYCVKCKTKREFEGELSLTKRQVRMAKGPCPECGTTICRILPKADPFSEGAS